MDLVLDEVVDQWDQSSEEETSHDFAVLNGLTVVGAQCKATKGPRQSRNKVGDHENVMPVMVVGRGDIGPSTTSQGAEDTNTGDDLRKSRVWSCGKNIPQKDEEESGTRGNSDEDLEK